MKVSLIFLFFVSSLCHYAHSAPQNPEKTWMDRCELYRERLRQLAHGDFGQDVSKTKRKTTTTTKRPTLPPPVEFGFGNFVQKVNSRPVVHSQAAQEDIMKDLKLKMNIDKYLRGEEADDNFRWENRGFDYDYWEQERR